MAARVLALTMTTLLASSRRFFTMALRALLEKTGQREVARIYWQQVNPFRSGTEYILPQHRRTDPERVASLTNYPEQS